MDQSTLTRQPCPICDSTEFAWGDVNPPSSVSYREDADSFFNQLVQPQWETRARRCRRCGNLQLFTLTDEER